MPWSCAHCSTIVAADTSLECPECGATKETWSLDGSRTFVVEQQKRLEVRRGRTVASKGEGPTGVSWALTEEAAVLRPAQLRALREGGEALAPEDLLAVWIYPGKQKRWKLTVSIEFEKQPLEEHELAFERDPDVLNAEGCYELRFACVQGGPELLEGVRRDPWAYTLDVSEGTGLGHAPRLQVRGFRSEPITLRLVSSAPAEDAAPEVAGGPVRKAVLLGNLFDSDQTFLLPAAIPLLQELEALYDDMRGGGNGVDVLVLGHADKSGDATYNRLLSELRAKVVGAFLQNRFEDWLSFYGGAAAGQPWGLLHDQTMLGALGGESPFYTGDLDGLLGPLTQAAVTAFQQFSNVSPGKTQDLVVDGILGPNTRRELVRVYMDQVGTTLEDAAFVSTHGCGESHPLLDEQLLAEARQGLSGDEFPDAPDLDRRVEVVLFERDASLASDQPATEPLPAASCPPSGCEQYSVWSDAGGTPLNLGGASNLLSLPATDDPRAKEAVELIGSGAFLPSPTCHALVELAAADAGLQLPPGRHRKVVVSALANLLVRAGCQGLQAVLSAAMIEACSSQQFILSVFLWSPVRESDLPERIKGKAKTRYYDRVEEETRANDASAGETFDGDGVSADLGGFMRNVTQIDGRREAKSHEEDEQRTKDDDHFTCFMVSFLSALLMEHPDKLMRCAQKLEADIAQKKDASPFAGLRSVGGAPAALKLMAKGQFRARDLALIGMGLKASIVPKVDGKLVGGTFLGYQFELFGKVLQIGAELPQGSRIDNVRVWDPTRPGKSASDHVGSYCTSADLGIDPFPYPGFGGQSSVVRGEQAALNSLAALRRKSRLQDTLLRPIPADPDRRLGVKLANRLTFLPGNTVHILRHLAGGKDREPPIGATYTLDPSKAPLTWVRSTTIEGKASDGDQVLPRHVSVDPKGRQSLPDFEWKSLP